MIRLAFLSLVAMATLLDCGALERELHKYREEVAALEKRLGPELEKIQPPKTDISIWLSGNLLEDVAKTWSAQQRQRRTIRWHQLTSAGTLAAGQTLGQSYSLESIGSGSALELEIAALSTEFSEQTLGLVIDYRLKCKLRLEGTLAGQSFEFDLEPEFTGFLNPKLEIERVEGWYRVHVGFPADQTLPLALRLPLGPLEITRTIHLRVPQQPLESFDLPRLIKREGSFRLGKGDAAVLKKYTVVFKPLEPRINGDGLSFGGAMAFDWGSRTKAK